MSFTKDDASGSSLSHKLMAEAVDQPMLQEADDAVGLQPAVERTLAVESVKEVIHALKAVETSYVVEF